jgi:parvulin-like peptidyl-prolyl isomerase
MFQTLKPLLFLTAVSLTLANAPAAQPTQTNTAPAAQSSSGDPVVAKGKGVEIRRSQLEKEVAVAKAQLAAKGRAVSPEQSEDAERQVLEQLINVQLVQARATAADKAEGKAAAEKRYAAAQKALGSEEAFNLQLKIMGTTREALMAKWTEALTADAVLKREFKISITDADVRKYYDDNPTQFEMQDKVRFSHILFATIDLKNRTPIEDDQKAAKRKQAEELLKRARAGEDFAKLAREYSDDPVSKARGGEYTVAHGQMVPEVEAAAFAMNTNQIGDLVTSAYGYHIIKVSEKIPAHKIPFADAATDIKSTLTQQALQNVFPDYIARVRQEAGLEILDDKLKPKEATGMQPVPAPPAPKKP